MIRPAFGELMFGEPFFFVGLKTSENDKNFT
jgi:hypothetical protein